MSHGEKKISNQNKILGAEKKNPHGERKSLAEKEKVSHQKNNSCAERKSLTLKENVSLQKKISRNKTRKTKILAREKLKSD